MRSNLADIKKELIVELESMSTEALEGVTLVTRKRGFCGETKLVGPQIPGNHFSKPGSECFCV